MVLEKFLQGYAGAFLLISHDREFLRRTTDHILEVEGGEITKFNGTIDDYFEQKELLRAQLASRAMSLEEKRRQILDFVARFGAKATKASQAQSRLKALDRMESIEVKPLPVTAKIRIPAPGAHGKTGFESEVRDARLWREAHPAGSESSNGRGGSPCGRGSERGREKHAAERAWREGLLPSRVRSNTATKSRSRFSISTLPRS